MPIATTVATATAASTTSEAAARAFGATADAPPDTEENGEDHERADYDAYNHWPSVLRVSLCTC